MNRSGRRACAILSAASLLLCLAVCAAWLRAQWAGGYLEHMTLDPAGMRDRLRMAWFYRQALVLHGENTQWLAGDRATLSFYLASGRQGWHWEPLSALDLAPPARPSIGTRLGFRFVRRTDVGPQLQRESLTVALPYWFLALLTAVAPATHLRLVLRRRRRARAGLCPVCGYDLRASPERCPECGHVVERKAPAPS